MPPAELSRISWGGSSAYLHGANLPWLNWGCDFGCGAAGGASSTASKAELERVFASAKAAGLTTVRWWMFPGEPTQFVVDGAGVPTGLKPAVYEDFRAAAALAQRHGIRLVLVLFSAPSAIPVDWLLEGPQQDGLVRTLSQLFGLTRGVVFSWEIVNEPEWDIGQGRSAVAPLRTLIGKLAAAVHQSSDAFVSVGSANIKGLPLWTGLGLDYYDAHWYDPMGPDACALCTTYADLWFEFRLDKPMVIGEFFAGPDTAALARFKELRDRGYAGAWAWSLLPGRTSDGMTVDLTAAEAFASGR